MWFLLLAGGAVVVQLAVIPASRRLPVSPSPELLLACWFLVATMVRVAVMRARLAAYERKARKLARRTNDRAAISPIGELGLGVGRGAFQVVAGDVVGASLSLVAALLRGAAGSLKAQPPPPKERRKGTVRERLAAAICVLGVGLTCVGLAWWPLLRGPATRAATPALRELGLVPDPPRVVRSPGAAGHGTIGPPGGAPVPVEPAPVTPEPATVETATSGPVSSDTATPAASPPAPATPSPATSTPATSAPATPAPASPAPASPAPASPAAASPAAATRSPGARP